MKMLKLQIFALSFLLLLMDTCSEIDLSPVLVQCSNVTLSSDNYTGSCWKEGASIVCNSLEHGLREAERLGMSMLVENTSQCICSELCIPKFHCKSHKHDCLCTSPLNITASSPVQKRPGPEKQHDLLIPITSSSTYQCSPGFIPHNDHDSQYLSKETTCVCLNNVSDIVKCVTEGDSQTALIQDGFCMTYSNATDSITIAECMYSCPRVDRSLLDDKTSFHFLPENVNHLQETMCSQLNRQGFLCSECKPGYVPLAHSYHLNCVQYELSQRQLALNWMGYLALAILPQSIIFLLMVVFRAGVTAPPFVSMVQVFQAMTAPLYVQAMIQLLSCWNNPENRMGAEFLRVLVTFYGFFNLDFFRILAPSLRLNLNMIELLLLDYALVFWPLFLIIWTYLLTVLHSQGLKPIVLLWKPVQVFMGRFQREWRIKISLVETSASFLLLSWIKLLSISFNLLTMTCIFTVDKDGNISKDCNHLFILPKMKFFDRRHFAFVILAISIFIIFVIVPLILLLLYPFNFFQNLLNRCVCKSQALRVFMNSFQGSFRDGSDGNSDCRWLSSAYVIVRIIVLLVGSVARNRTFFPIASTILMACAVAVGIFQPYKRSAHNTFEATLLLVLAAFFASHGAASIAQLATTQGFLQPSIVLTFILGILPIVVSAGYLVWWIVKGKQSGAQFCVHVRQWWHVRRASVEDSLPDRVNNPQDYQLVSLT